MCISVFVDVHPDEDLCGYKVLTTNDGTFRSMEIGRIDGREKLRMTRLRVMGNINKLKLGV